MSQDVVILGGARTPIGKFGGSLRPLAAIELGAPARRHADRGALLNALVAPSRLGVDAEGVIRELDINPLMVLEDGRGAMAVDALVGLERA